MTEYSELHATAPAALPVRVLAFGYALAAYLLFFATFVYFIFFIAGILVPKTVDGGAASVTAGALFANIGLMALFGVQHSVMARPAFKRVWKRVVPDHLERSTYVLASTLVMMALIWGWQPLPQQIWLVTQPAWFWLLWGLFALGWAVLLASTFMTDHFDLFGLRQAAVHLSARTYEPVVFKSRLLYRYVRHPLYAGFLLAFWATPDMTLGRLVLAGGLSLYILVGTLLEERDLKTAFGERYRAYCQATPRYL